jgi:hypothetical protein
MKLNSFIATIVVLGAVAVAGSAHAIVFGQLDDFQNGTTQNWANGSGSAPPILNIATGGPAGAGDRFIQVTSIGGIGPGSHLTTINREDWLGNYISEGITVIEVDLENLGAVTLSIRLAFRYGVFDEAPGYLSEPIILAPGSGWQHAVFAINPMTMTPIDNPEDFNIFFANNFAELRFVNEAGAADLEGDPVVAQLGIDNIHAVPEPSAALLTGFGGLLALIAAHRRKRI